MRAQYRSSPLLVRFISPLLIVRSHIIAFVFYSIAAILQAQIFEDDSKPNKNMYPHFNVMPDLPPEYGGHINAADLPESILIQETINDYHLREKIIQGIVPTVDTIFRCLFMFYTKIIAYFHPLISIHSLRTGLSTSSTIGQGIHPSATS